MSIQNNDDFQLCMYSIFLLTHYKRWLQVDKHQLIVKLTLEFLRSNAKAFFSVENDV